MKNVIFIATKEGSKTTKHQQLMTKGQKLLE
jgi:hypothetical protein